MKTKALLATLLVATAASADARFAWPYPPKALSPNEIGHWIVINGDAWPDSAAAELTFTKEGSTVQVLQTICASTASAESSVVPPACQDCRKGAVSPDTHSTQR